VCQVRHAFAKDRTAFVCVLFAVALTVVGCTQTSVDAKRDSVTLRFGVASPKTGLPTGGVPGFISNLLSESLIGIGWDGRPFARIATEWTPSEDGLTLDLRFRDNLLFHDGTPADGEFFKNELKRIFARSANDSHKSVTSVELVEPNLIRIKLSRREALLVLDLANSSLSHPKDPSIGVGPFKLITRTPTTRLAAFDHYYRGRPSVDFIEVREYEEQRSSWAAFMRGEIDAVHELSPAAGGFMEAEGQSNVRTFPFIAPYYIHLVFNLRNPILRNVAIRQALSHAVDRKAVIDEGLNQQGEVAEGPIWPFHWAYSTAQKTYTHNIEAATIRFDSAGFRIKPPSKPGQMPARFTLRCLTVAKEARYEKMALVLQKQFYEVGVDLQIEALPADELYKRLGTGEFDTVLIQRTSGRSLGWTYNSFHSSKMAGGYSSADKILDRLRSTTSDAEVKNVVSDLQQVFYEDPPAIFIAWPKVKRAVSTSFAVPEEPAPDQRGRDVLGSLWQWRLAEHPK
jgi:peptide/nickel transport system substrate-binding protein